MKLRLVLALFLFSLIKLNAQEVIQYAPGFEFREGVYLTFEQFKSNRPIPKNSIISKFNHSDTEFLPTILDAKTFSYKDERDSTRIVNVSEVWGFSRNDNIFIRVEEEFNRIPVLGSISHFMASITVYYNNFNGPFYNPYYGPTTPSAHQELRQMILDFQTGRTSDFTQENLEFILERDLRLSEEFSKLKKSQKKDLMFLYLRKYNEKHPIYFPAE